MTSSSMICKNFTQNAWKKDLCSNCFKSEVEHWPITSRLITANTNNNNVNNRELSAKLIGSVDNIIGNKAMNNNLNNNHNNHNNYTNQAMNAKNLQITINNNNNNHNNSIRNTGESKNTTTLINNYNNMSLSSSKVLQKNFSQSSSTSSSLSTAAKPHAHDKILINGTSNNNNNNNHNASINSANHYHNDASFRNKRILEEKSSEEIVYSAQQQNANNSGSNSNDRDANNTHNKDKKFSQTATATTTAAAIANNCSNKAFKSSQLKETVDSMPLVGILKKAKRDFINRHNNSKQQSDNNSNNTKCLVFKEGDPLIIGCTGIDCIASDDDDCYDDNEFDDCDDNDDFYDDDEDIDEEEYYSDDKQLRDLTRENTKYNSSFVNLSITAAKDNDNSNDSIANNKNSGRSADKHDYANNKTDHQIVGNNSDDSVSVIANCCEKLVETKIIESIIEGAVNCGQNNINSNSSCNNSDDDYLHENVIYSPTTSDVLMSTSSDSSSIDDDKEDIPFIDNIVSDVLNTQIIIERKSKIADDSHLESEVLSIDSDLSFEENEKLILSESLKEADEQISKDIDDCLKVDLSTKPSNNTNNNNYINNTTKSAKPILPVKPTILPQKPKLSLVASRQHSKEELPKRPLSPSVSLPAKITDESANSYYLPKIVSDHIYQEVYPNSDAILGSDTPLMSDTIGDSAGASNQRELKLAELAQELEMMRQIKRPAPKPPKRDYYDDDGSTSRHDKLSKKSSSKFSIRKLLQKKSAISHESVSQPVTTDALQSSLSAPDLSAKPSSTSNPKAWKNSEFNRTNLKIVHPIDLVCSVECEKADDTDNSGGAKRIDNVSVAVPEAPPRTPKPNRPVVPTRKKSKVLSSPPREPPPPPEKFTLLAPNFSVKCTLTEAYNELAKLNYSNIVAVKNRVESVYSKEYNWSDFEIGCGERYESIMVYKDAIISNTGKSVNLLVLPNCYLPANVHKFKRHNDLVAVLDDNWSNYYLLDELNPNRFDERLTNSLILQLYTILENYESSGCHRLPANTIKSIVIAISWSLNDCLLIVPNIDDSEEHSDTSSSSSSSTPLQQFLFLMLEKLLPNSLFSSVAYILCQQTISLSLTHSKVILQLIAFQTPIEDIDSELKLCYWFDINRCKFLNHYFVANELRCLTQLDFIYLQFLCNDDLKSIYNAIDSKNKFLTLIK